MKDAEYKEQLIAEIASIAQQLPKDKLLLLLAELINRKTMSERESYLTPPEFSPKYVSNH